MAAGADGRLSGKVALITGGDRGQGEAEARLFVAEGAKGMMGDLRDEDGGRGPAAVGAKVMMVDVLDDYGRRFAAELGDAAAYCHHDVTSESAWAAVVEATHSA